MAEKGSNSHGVDESVKVERGEEERAREKKRRKKFRWAGAATRSCHALLEEVIATQCNGDQRNLKNGARKIGSLYFSLESRGCRFGLL
jgi:hypothetical protein